MFKKILLSLFVLYAILGFIIVPMVLKPKVVEIANQQLNAKLSIDDIYLNPFIFKLELSGVQLKDLEGNHLVSFKSLDVDVELYSLFVSALHVKSIKLNKPKISLVYNKDKTINLASILKPQEELKEDKKVDDNSTLPRIIIDKISIKKGAIDYEDYTHEKKFDFSLKSLSFKLQDIDTNDFESSGATIRFHTALGESGTLDLRAKVKGLKPLKIEGSLDFEETKLYEELDYIDNNLGVEVANGSIFFHADYAVNLDKLDDTLIDNISLSLKRLRVKPKDQNHDVLNLKLFDVYGVSVKPFKQDVHVENVLLNSLRIKAQRDKNGDIDWSKWFAVKETKDIETKVVQKIEKVEENTPDWNVVLDNISLEKIALHVEDESVNPSVTTKLNELNINLKNVTLAGDKPFTFNMNLLLNDKFTCRANGDVIHKILEVNSYLTCRDFNIVHYRPYIDQIANNELKVYDLLLSSAYASFDINTSIKDENSSINAVVNNANFSLDKLQLNKKSTKEKLVGFKSFEINGLHVETKNKSVNISEIALNGLKIDAEKSKDGLINFDGLVEPRKVKKPKVVAKKKKETPYRIKLKHFALNKAEVNFNDESIQKTTNSKIDKITLNAYNIDSNKNSWLKYNMFMRINDTGTISSKGKVRHTPLKQKGNFKIDKLSLKEITPYLQESMYADLKDGFISLNSKVEYAKDDKNPDLLVDGSFDLESFELADSRSDTILLSIAKANLKTFNLKLFPSSIYIDEVELDSFFVDAVIDKNKVMNFAKLAKPKDTNTTEVKVEVENNATKSEPFNYKVMRINVKNGTSNFADYSLPIPFKTSMHTLNGDIYSISNDKNEITSIDIHGEVDKYGSNKIKGSLKSANFKSFTDISVSFKNLALDSYSGYSAQFAGYKITSGKLFLDLEYKIKDSELLGKNNLMIKKIELGEEVDDENITSLPLGFAIALLEDGDGIIDIDMPVDGNLDSPDFKYGALILKTFANLIVKAVASPFKFLGAAMGINGEELEFADFEPGSAAVLAPEREKMDNIAKILDKKPKLSFEIIGTYDVKVDKLAMQRAKAKAKVLALNTKKEEATLILVEAVETIYEQAVGEETLEKLQEEMKKKFPDEKVYENEYKDILFAKTIALEKVSQEELDNLAKTRANALKDYLINTKGMDATRIVSNTVLQSQEENEKFVKTELKIIVK